MLKKGRQKKYLDVAWEALLMQLEVFCTSHDPEALHRLRVEAKKIKAWISLAKCTGNILHTGALKTVFFHAGEIRIAHVHLQLMAALDLDGPKFTEEWQQAAAAETREFCRKYPVYAGMLKKERRQMTGSLDGISDGDAMDWYRKTLKQLRRDFAKPGNCITRLHLNRKKIKDLLYLADLLPGSPNAAVDLDTARLDQLQEAIGKWHDVVALIEYFGTKELPDTVALDRLRRQRRQCHIRIGALANALYDVV